MELFPALIALSTSWIIFSKLRCSESIISFPTLNCVDNSGFIMPSVIYQIKDCCQFKQAFRILPYRADGGMEASRRELADNPAKLRA